MGKVGEFINAEVVSRFTSSKLGIVLVHEVYVVRVDNCSIVTLILGIVMFIVCLLYLYYIYI